jgi:O-antigen/teichoic acid export membrane protein
MFFLDKLLAQTGMSSLISTKTFRNISTLMSGTLISAIIPIITAPIMSRLFTTSDYGVLGVYMSISGLIGVLAYSHYSQAIMLPKFNDEAKQVIWFVICFAGVISIMTMLVLIALWSFSGLILNSAIGKWSFFLPLSILFNGINTSLLLWANRVQQYKTLANNKIIQALLTAVLQIILGVYIKNETGLLVGLIFGQLMSVLLLLKNFNSKNEFGIGTPIVAKFKYIGTQYKSLLIYSTPSEFINNLINQTPIFLLQKFGGLAYVGSYNFTTRFLGLPQQFLSSAIVDVFKQKASSAYNTIGNCKEIFIKTFKFLSLVGVLPFGILIVVAPSLFSVVFGQQWRMAGVFAQYLSLMYYFRFVISPLSYIYIVAGKLKEDFILHLLFLLLTTCSFYLGNKIFEDKIYLILLYSIAYSSVYLIYLYRSFIFSKGNLN